MNHVEFTLHFFSDHSLLMHALASRSQSHLALFWLGHSHGSRNGAAFHAVMSVELKNLTNKACCCLASVSVENGERCVHGLDLIFPVVLKKTLVV
jgi:hypothetical protein